MTLIAANDGVEAALDVPVGADRRDRSASFSFS